MKQNRSAGPTFKAQVHEGDVTPFAVANPVVDTSANSPDDADIEEMRRRVESKQQRLELQRREAELDQELGRQRNQKRMKVVLIASLVVVLLIGVVVGILCGTGNCGGGGSNSNAAPLGGAIPRTPPVANLPTMNPPITANPPAARQPTSSSSSLATNVLCNRAILFESTVQGDLQLAAAASDIERLCHGHDRGTAHRDPGLFYSTRAPQGSFSRISVCGTVGDLSVSVGVNGCEPGCAEQVQELREVNGGRFCHVLDVVSTSGSELTMLVYGSTGEFELKIEPSALADNAQCPGAMSVQANVPTRGVTTGDLALGFVDTSLVNLCHGHDKGSSPSGPGLWYKSQALDGDFSTIKVCGLQRDLSVSVGSAGCDGGCATVVREDRLTENGMFCHLMDIATSFGDDIRVLIYGDTTEFDLQVYQSDLPSNAICEGALFLPVTPNVLDEGTIGDLTLGFIDPKYSNLCFGHNQGGATSGPGLWYKTQAANGSPFTALKVCGSVSELSISAGTLCSGGCAEVVQDIRMEQEDGMFCHQVDIDRASGEEIVALIYGNTDVFDVQAFESTLAANVICSGATRFDTFVEGNLSLGTLDSTFTSVCHGLDQGSQPSGRSLFYTFLAPSNSETTTVQICADAEEISMSLGPNGCNLGCATVVSETRTSTEPGLFCHNMTIETTPGNEILVFVYGTADAFSLTVEQSSS